VSGKTEEGILEFRVEDGKAVFSPRGDLTVERADEVREALRQSLRKTQHLVLDLSEVSAVDLSFLQLLCATCKTALAEGRTLTRCGGNREAFWDSVERAGYPSKWGCLREGETSCLWISAEAGP
jgi:anti-anti-sigma regulatory factor